MKCNVQALLCSVLLAGGLYFVVSGHGVVGYAGLSTMFVGLAMLLLSLYVFNKMG
ncbi:MAG: DUF6903 family protein [Erysipelotrichaceae bacterium]